ncbi:hypothetical protein KHHGKMAE_4329 [Methylobacterium persicinum]|nr:hypothetical protein KHHGKMAE_4329 [Methylobacterium persicinum]
METAPGRCDLPMSEPAPLDPAAIQFNELCLWLERAYPQPGGLGATGAPRRERVRFRANPTLAFPAEEVAAVALPAGPGEPVIVTANLFGLHGPSSPLPPAVTERIVHAQEDGALRAFLDFFNHRLLALLFRIWKHYRHQHRYRAGGTDPITDAVAALFGKVGREGGDGTPSRTLLLPYTGLLALPTRSASSVARIVSHYFGHPCAVEEFIPREIRIPDDALWRLGAAEMGLGVETVAGRTMPDNLGKFRLRLGPLTAAACDRLLPDGPDHRRLIELIRFSIRDPLEWDIAFVLAPGEAQPMRLGVSRLGWSGWLKATSEGPVEFVVGTGKPS